MATECYRCPECEQYSPVADWEVISTDESRHELDEDGVSDYAIESRARCPACQEVCECYF